MKDFFTMTKGGVFLVMAWLFMIGPIQAEKTPDHLVVGPSIDDVSFVDAIKEISARFEVFFTFDLKLVEGIMVDDSFREYQSVENAVEYVLQKTSLKYRIIQNQYVIIYKDDDQGIESLRQMSRHLDGLISEGEQSVSEPSKPEVRVAPIIPTKPVIRHIEPIAFNVEGTVTDENGEPLIGVNIQVKGSSKGASTDFEGAFTLEGIDENAVLIVSYVGYVTQEVSVSGNRNLSIVMVADSQLLDEVVVVGYGTQKKANLTGSVATT